MKNKEALAEKLVGKRLALPFIPEIRSINVDSRTITFVASTEAEDRYGDVVEQAGWVLTNYLNNPVVLWSHDGRIPAIGASTRVAREKTPRPALVQDVRFATKASYPFADQIFNLYCEKILNAVSVGFMVLERPQIRVDPTTEEFLGYRFTKQELLELSCCNIPANPEALGRAISKGLLSEGEITKGAIDFSKCDLSRHRAYELKSFAEESPKDPNEIKLTELREKRRLLAAEVEEIKESGSAKDFLEKTAALSGIEAEISSTVAAQEELQAKAIKETIVTEEPKVEEVEKTVPAEEPTEKAKTEEVAAVAQVEELERKDAAMDNHCIQLALAETIVGSAADYCAGHEKASVKEMSASLKDMKGKISKCVARLKDLTGDEPDGSGDDDEPEELPTVATEAVKDEPEAPKVEEKAPEAAPQVDELSFEGLLQAASVLPEPVEPEKKELPEPAEEPLSFEDLGKGLDELSSANPYKDKSFAELLEEVVTKTK